jgi:DNA-binding transcriptional regulator GbsR (MarR family)
MKDEKYNKDKEMIASIFYYNCDVYNYKIITYNQIAKITDLSISRVKMIVDDLINDNYITATIYVEKGDKYKTYKAYKLKLNKTY